MAGVAAPKRAWFSPDEVVADEPYRTGMKSWPTFSSTLIPASTPSTEEEDERAAPSEVASGRAAAVSRTAGAASFALPAEGPPEACEAAPEPAQPATIVTITARPVVRMHRTMATTLSARATGRPGASPSL
ncbi:hypothetical protein GCM10014719_08620 [Planomonospora parontospora subsp. antibiotica]|nr:hypothetical protein GCM10014719_08620 [Planomonospora parontospora subsp. antibiotica]GII14483.1 hypothetical protein Ppa05_12090 [Planomonospora parontospora subsp. antibiotica]